MIRPSQMFSAQQREQVAQAVRDAEAKTAAEIVPVVARDSGRYDRAEDVAGLWLGLVFLTVVWLLWPAPVLEQGSWEGAPAVYQLLALIAATALGFFIGAAAVARLDSLRHLFAAPAHMRDEVKARAHALASTAGRW
ncbi:MAG: hypothetical protein U0793_10310 [Gemmataceae bacterium]